MKIAVLASDNSPASTIAGPLEILTVASLLATQQRSRDSGRPFDLMVVAKDSNPVCCQNNVRILPDRAVVPFEAVDVVIIGALGPPPKNGYRLDPELIAWLQAQAAAGAVLASVCTGAFLLAATGLLDGRIATTHWAYANLFHHLYPAVSLCPEKLLTTDGQFICSGGATSYQDLALHLIQRRLGRSLAVQCAKLLLIPLDRDSQGEYAEFQCKRSF